MKHLKRFFVKHNVFDFLESIDLYFILIHRIPIEEYIMILKY